MRRLTTAVYELIAALSQIRTALSDVAREQRITNLIVRSQISTDADEKARLLDEARQRMDTARRRSPHAQI